MPTGLGTDTPFEQHAAKIDVWDAGPNQFAQEPIFCPRAGAEEEDDGWVFTMVYDTPTDRSHLAILNAQDLKAGPVARIKLPHKIPFGQCACLSVTCPLLCPAACRPACPVSACLPCACVPA